MYEGLFSYHHCYSSAFVLLRCKRDSFLFIIVIYQLCFIEVREGLWMLRQAAQLNMEAVEGNIQFDLDSSPAIQN